MNTIKRLNTEIKLWPIIAYGLITIVAFVIAGAYIYGKAEGFLNKSNTKSYPHLAVPMPDQVLKTDLVFIPIEANGRLYFALSTTNKEFIVNSLK